LQPHRSDANRTGKTYKRPEPPNRWFLNSEREKGKKAGQTPSPGKHGQKTRTPKRLKTQSGKSPNPRAIHLHRVERKQENKSTSRPGGSPATSPYTGKAGQEGDLKRRNQGTKSIGVKKNGERVKRTKKGKKSRLKDVRRRGQELRGQMERDQPRLHGKRKQNRGRKKKEGGDKRERKRGWGKDDSQQFPRRIAGGGPLTEEGRKKVSHLEKGKKKKGSSRHKINVHITDGGGQGGSKEEKYRSGGKWGRSWAKKQRVLNWRTGKYPATERRGIC